LQELVNNSEAFRVAGSYKNADTIMAHLTSAAYLLSSSGLPDEDLLEITRILLAGLLQAMRLMPEPAKEPVQ
jgi:hypothetical protein